MDLTSKCKDINWKREWFPKVPLFPRTFWISHENRRKFLDSLTLHFKIKAPSDWGKVTIQDFNRLGGYALLKIYNKSIFKCLEAMYPGSNSLNSSFHTPKELHGKKNGLGENSHTKPLIGVQLNNARHFWKE